MSKSLKRFKCCVCGTPPMHNSMHRCGVSTIKGAPYA